MSVSSGKRQSAKQVLEAQITLHHRKKEALEVLREHIEWQFLSEKEDALLWEYFIDPGRK